MDERTKQHLASTTRFADLRELDEVDSTNRYLMDLARTGAAEGVVVVADYQSAGRGRRGRVWEAPPGTALLASILLRPSPADLPPERRWLAPAAVALAAIDACERAASAAPSKDTGGAAPSKDAGDLAPSKHAGDRGRGVVVPGGGGGGDGVAGAGRGYVVKWPNDVLLGDRKLAGILAEVEADAVVVGIGINVGWAPPGAAFLGRSVDRGRLLAAVLATLERWYGRWDEVGGAYRRRCATLGREVRVETPDGTILVGRAEAIEADGRLRVVTDGRAQCFSAADVVHLREAGAC